MKKILLSILMVGTLFTLSACGKDGSNDSNDTGKAESVKNTKKYDDLTMTRMIGSFDDVWIDFPGWREDGSETCTVVESYNYYIIAVISKEDYTFEELFNEEAKSNLRHFVDRGNYDDFVPDKTEDVSFSNGIKTTKFEGTLHLEDYGDEYNYPAYGYYFKYNNYPIMIMSVETDTGSQLNSEESWLQANDYVDRMIETIKNSNN